MWFLLLFPSTLRAQDVTASVTTDPLPKTLRLSDSVQAKLVIEGPAPLRVELPKPLLVPEADQNWKVLPVGPPAVTPLAKGRERWAQAFRLDPYAAGEFAVAFAPVKVNDKAVNPGGFGAVVRTDVGKGAKPNDVTGIEELPPPPGNTGGSFPPWVWAAAGAAGAVVVVLVVAWRVRRRPAPVPPDAWAAAAFDRLEKERLSGAELADGVAGVVRGFIDRRFGIPATKFTTAELLAAAEAAGWPVEQADTLRGLLADCDRARFAGDVPDDDGLRDLLARGRDWVHQVSPGGAGPG